MAKKKDKQKDEVEAQEPVAEEAHEHGEEAHDHDHDHEGHDHDHDHEGHDHDHDHDHDHEGHDHNQGPSEEDLAEYTRRRALQQIRQYPDPALRMRANEVETFDSDLASLVERMQNVMLEAQGVGLAANQVGVLQRIFVFAPEEGEVQAIVNPQIVDPSKKTETDEEGCLSLQGVRVPVERHETIVLEGKDPTGRDVRFELEGLAARAAQHEVDHLDGILIIDRTSPENHKEAMRVLRPQPVLP